MFFILNQENACVLKSLQNHTNYTHMILFEIIGFFEETFTVCRPGFVDILKYAGHPTAGPAMNLNIPLLHLAEILVRGLYSFYQVHLWLPSKKPAGLFRVQIICRQVAKSRGRVFCFLLKTHDLLHCAV